jgi:hypothetical protein
MVIGLQAEYQIARQANEVRTRLAFASEGNTLEEQ